MFGKTGAVECPSKIGFPEISQNIVMVKEEVWFENLFFLLHSRIENLHYRYVAPLLSIQLFGPLNNHDAPGFPDQM
jgi:hypothetical protein